MQLISDNKKVCVVVAKSQRSLGPRSSDRVTLEVDLTYLLLEKGLMPMLTTLSTLYSLQKTQIFIILYNILFTKAHYTIMQVH